MLRAIAMRLLGVIPVLLMVTFMLFVLLRLAPGDAADLLAPEDATQQEVAQVRARWGLDKPIPVQYFDFLRSALRFDFGRSHRYDEDVFKLIRNRLPATLELAILSIALAAAIALPLGILAALARGKFVDGAISVIAIAGVSMPAFWLGILLVLLLSAEFHLLPSSGRLPYGINVTSRSGLLTVDSLLAGRPDLLPTIFRYLALPALTLAFNAMGVIARITRGAIIDVAAEEFIVTAVAKGMTRRRIVRTHLVPNAMIPITTILGLELGVLISGSIIVEVVFSWPGLGTLLYQAISVRDIPLTTGIVVTYTAIFIFINLAIDILYFIVDPRLRAAQTT